MSIEDNGLVLQDKISHLLDILSLEEIFYECDITPEEALLFLFDCGVISLPEFMEDRFDKGYGEDLEEA